LDSLTDLNSRIDRMAAREAQRRADSERAARQLHERQRYQRQQQNQAAMADLQSRADDALSPWSIRAPSPSAEDDERSYRLRLMKLAASQLPPEHELRFSFGSLSDHALSVFEPRVLQACRDAVSDASTLPEGRMREVKEDRDGRRFSSFVGAESFVKSMMPEARRVTAFCRRDGSFRDG
jgi:hypothetical protein